MNDEYKKSLAGMEEIPLEDTDGTSMEHRLLMAYMQRRLSASKYGQLLEREAKAEEESRETMQAGSLPEEEEEVALSEISPADHKLPSQNEDQKKEKKKKKKEKKEKEKKAKKAKARSTWKCLWAPSCLRPQGKGDGIQRMFSNQKAVINGYSIKLEGAGSLLDGQNDSEISHLVERLVEIVDHSKFPSGRQSFQVVERTLSLEEDGGWASKPSPQDGDEGIDNEEKIIDAIVALLRKSGDELQETMQKNKTFWQRIRDTITSYAFFRRVIDQYFEETPIDSTGSSEDQVKSIKVALMMEATAKLTAVDRHPMNFMLGFGTKYLQENFSPWIQSRGGWGKALGLPDQEE